MIKKRIISGLEKYYNFSISQYKKFVTLSKKNIIFYYIKSKNKKK